MTKLLGDMTTDALKAFGADKVAQFYERKTGRSCNCAARREMMNNIHRAALRAWNRTAQRQAQAASLRPPPTVQNTDPVYQPPTKPVDE